MSCEVTAELIWDSAVSYEKIATLDVSQSIWEFRA